MSPQLKTQHTHLILHNILIFFVVIIIIIIIIHKKIITTTKLSLMIRVSLSFNSLFSSFRRSFETSSLEPVSQRQFWWIWTRWGRDIMITPSTTTTTNTTTNTRPSRVGKYSCWCIGCKSFVLRLSSVVCLCGGSNRSRRVLKWRTCRIHYWKWWFKKEVSEWGERQ